MIIDFSNGLQDLISGAAPADGAFYVYVDLTSSGIEDSSALCYKILEEAGVAITPGIDFEDPSSGLGRKRIRFSFSRDTEEVREGMRLFKDWSCLLLFPFSCTSLFAIFQGG